MRYTNFTVLHFFGNEVAYQGVLSSQRDSQGASNKNSSLTNLLFEFFDLLAHFQNNDLSSALGVIMDLVKNLCNIFQFSLTPHGGGGRR